MWIDYTKIEAPGHCEEAVIANEAIYTMVRGLNLPIA
jgi:hypothetical protein